VRNTGATRGTGVQAFAYCGISLAVVPLHYPPYALSLPSAALAPSALYSLSLLPMYISDGSPSPVAVSSARGVRAGASDAERSRTGWTWAPGAASLKPLPLPAACARAAAWKRDGGSYGGELRAIVCTFRRSYAPPIYVLPGTTAARPSCIRYPALLQLAACATGRGAASSICLYRFTTILHMPSLR